jgi:hypothetical protein
LVVFAVMLLPGAGYLRIDRQGFTTCALFRATFTPWSTVRGFGVTRVGYRRMVGVNLEPSGRLAAGVGRVNASLLGFEGALPDTYKMSAEALAALMNEALAQARSIAPPPSPVLSHRRTAAKRLEAHRVRPKSPHTSPQTRPARRSAAFGTVVWRALLDAFVAFAAPRSDNRWFKHCRDVSGTG